MIAILTMSSTCSDDDDTFNSNTDIAEIKNVASTGVWVITYFYDTDHEETNNFTGYQFDFSSNENLIATKNTSIVNGTWSVTSSSSSSNDVDFNILFSTPTNFEELSDDWEIIRYTSTKIELIDISGGNGGTDYLTFEKI
ncbi:MAG: hypothetical protein COA67_05475 [Lutibacter sp.]|nr:MAG: hypothetical protein COA67_05475 [Lutibacter sp.]